MESINYRQLLERYRQDIERLNPPYGDEALKIFEEAICGCVLLAEENLREQRAQYENADLVREVIKYAKILEGYDHMLNLLYSVLSRAESVLYEHPRLMLELKRLHLAVLRRLEAVNGREIGLTEDLMQEIDQLCDNISYADKGEYNNIRSDSMLKHDPVEWSKEWEESIDKADRIVYSELEDTPRGMGFCFAFWSKRAEVLRKEFNIEWRSPSVMNPREMFD